MKEYKTSKDYKHLKELLDNGYQVVGFCAYNFNGGYHATDVCRATCYHGMYQIVARGIEYCCYWPEMAKYKSFEDMCEKNYIEFIEPDL